MTAAQSFKLCPRNTPDMAKCVSDSINLLRPVLKSGDFGNGFFVDALDPIKLEDIIIDRGEGFYVNLNNLKATGASNFKITKFRINLEKFRVDAIVEVPKVEAFGLYRLKMLLGVLNLKGEGNFKANIGKMDFENFRKKFQKLTKKNRKMHD